MKIIFKADQGYLDNMKSYTRKDAYIALAYYLFNMVALYICGMIYAGFGKYFGNLLAVISIVLVLLLAKFNVSKVGIRKKGITAGVVTGLVMGVIFILSYTIIPGIVSGSELLPAHKITYNVFYYFVIIAFEEELSFRGFIQPRLYPLLKKEWLVILVGGILFVFTHYPFQMASRGMNAIEYFPLFIAGAPMQLIWHYVFSWLYRRFGNIYGGTILHGFVDMSMGIWK